ncbi:hypothetical protein TNCV_1032191 [Trichonephila clavipes]|nr:hypothetical protein TNCV_1032191 [Trichonephila clavipes]
MKKKKRESTRFENRGTSRIQGSVVEGITGYEKDCLRSSANRTKSRSRQNAVRVICERITSVYASCGTVLRGENAMECHSELVEALGNNALPDRAVARWVRKVSATTSVIR